MEGAAPCCADICSINRIMRLMDSWEMEGGAGVAGAGGVDDVAVGVDDIGVAGSMGGADRAAAIRDFNDGLVVLKGERQVVMRCPALPQFRHVFSFNRRLNSCSGTLVRSVWNISRSFVVMRLMSIASGSAAAWRS